MTKFEEANDDYEDEVSTGSDLDYLSDDSDYFESESDQDSDFTPSPMLQDSMSKLSASASKREGLRIHQAASKFTDTARKNEPYATRSKANLQGMLQEI